MTERYLESRIGNCYRRCNRTRPCDRAGACHPWLQCCDRVKVLSSEPRRLPPANPQKRALEPTEIAALVAFLCHDDARGITMEDIDVAGGALW